MITNINEWKKYNENTSALKNANDILNNIKNTPLWNSIITWLNEIDVDYINWSDLDIVIYYLDHEQEFENFN